jgi:hypothetical protein
VSKVLALDANLLLLLIVGLTDQRYLARHKRLRSYTASDYDLLLKFIAQFDDLVVTPNALSEAIVLDSLSESQRAHGFHG